MMVRSRRQALVEMAATLGAILVSASVLGRVFPRRGRAGKPGRPVGRGTGASAARVKPAPFTVKRHG